VTDDAFYKELRIEASPEIVFAHFTDPARMARWMGAPGSTTIEVDLVPDGEATVVQFTHRGLPPGPAEIHAEGWGHFLPRLATAAAGGDPGPDPWTA
jgi:uncharacterized protein YndB with AHSA1/START domain